MSDEMSARKDDHINLSLDARSQAEASPFGSIDLPYRALPETSWDDVTTSTQLFGRELRQPLIIASMSGGTELARKVNTNLALAAEQQKVALAVGSQRIAIANPDRREDFRRLRDLAPSIPLFANVGAVQFNYGLGVSQYLSAVKMIEADALYLHLNPLQEAIQPGGDRDFRNLLPKIEALVSACPVPVFAKEVGHGIDAETARRLAETGVAGIDVAGVGGTSYAWVEGSRAQQPATGDWFHDFGVPTPDALRAIAALELPVTVIASGGVRSPVDGLKAAMLGASYYSAGRPFLVEAMLGPEEAAQLIQEWEDGLRTALFATGSSSWPGSAGKTGDARSPGTPDGADDGIRIVALRGVPLIEPGMDIAAVAAEASKASGIELTNGDVLVVTSKIVSKSEGRLVPLSSVEPSERAKELATVTQKDPRLVELVLQESSSVVRARPGHLIVRHRLGYVSAMAGIDRSNVEPSGEVALLLPLDPDASAALIARRLRARMGIDVGVVISDSHGRPFRIGNGGVALGAFGVTAVRRLEGNPDLFGAPLTGASVVPVADLVASASLLASGEGNEGLPIILVRGGGIASEDSSGASGLIRPAHQDMFAPPTES